MLTNVTNEIERNFLSSTEKALIINDILEKMTNPFGIDGMGVTNVDLRVLDIDTSYRSPKPEKGRMFRAQWDAALVTPLTVSYRDGQLWLVDGINRVAEARNRNIPYLPAVIFTNLTKEREVNLAASQLWVRSLSHGYTHKMRLLLDDPTDISVKKICDKHRVGVCVRPESEPNRYLENVRFARKIVKDTGEDCLDWIISFIDKVGWLDARNGLSGKFLRAFYRVYTEAGQNNQLAVYTERLSQVLSAISTYTFYTYAIKKFPYMEIRASICILMQKVARGEITLKDILDGPNQAV